MKINDAVVAKAGNKVFRRYINKKNRLAPAP